MANVRPEPPMRVPGISMNGVVVVVVLVLFVVFVVAIVDDVLTVSVSSWQSTLPLFSNVVVVSTCESGEGDDVAVEDDNNDIVESKGA